MMRNVMFLGAMGLVACTADGSVDGDSGDSGTADACAANPISQQATFPEPGATDVYYRVPRIEVVMAAADASAVVSVDGPDGAVTGTQELDEDTVTFFPDVSLVPDTEYTVTLARDCGDISYTWSTDGTGNPIETDVVGKVYSLGLDDGNWVEPPGIGSALATVAAGIEVLVSPTEASKNVSFRGGLGDTKGNQDICVETFPLSGASFDDPYFELEAKVLPFAVTGVSVDIEDLFLSGAFAPDGSSLDGMVLEGTVDTRPLVPALGLEGKTGVCDLAYKLTVGSVTCQPCADGSGPFCLTLRVENLTALEVVGGSLVERSPAEIAEDERCAVKQ